MNTINPTVLAMPVTGTNLRSGTLRDQLGSEPTLLVFLRHSGCLFCRETVADLREVAAANPDYPPVLFVHQGTAEDGAGFFGRYWPEARAIADPNRLLYTAFGIGRVNVGQVFDAGLWACGLRATRKGHSAGVPVGDIFVMPGLFLVQGETVLWRHEFRHAGDHPDFATIGAVAR